MDVVWIRQAAFILLVLIGFSDVADAADKRSPEHRLLAIKPAETVALALPITSLQDQKQSKTDTTVSSEKKDFQYTPKVPERPWVYMVIHHSGTRSGSVNAIHENHRRRKDSAGNPWLGIGYHFVIGNGNGMPDGAIEPTFRWRQQLHGAHAGSVVHNANGIGICLIGDFEKEKPTSKQLEAVRRLTRQLAQRYDIPPRLLIGHRDVKPTACPGKYFPLQDVRRNMKSKN